MTTDPYGNAGSATFGPGGQAPVAPGYGISDPFPGTYGDDTGATATSVGGSTGGGNPTTETAKAEAGQVKDTAKAEAGQVKDAAAGAAQQVAGTAKNEAGNVVGEAKAQASNLVDQVRGEAGSQVSNQKDRLADLAHSYAKQLGSMASGSPEAGPVTDLAQDLSARLGGAGHWLQNHEPADVLEEVRRFARRRPGAFLLSALAAGVVVGRLTRGAVDEHRSDSSSSSNATPQLTSGPAYQTPAPATYTEPLGYGTQPTTTGYGAEPVAGYGDQTYVEGSDLTDPYAGRGATYGTNPGDVR